MATTVDSAFNSFNKNSVNLDAGTTKLGRISRDYLIKQLCDFDSQDDSTFPFQYAGNHINFGSFARNTKMGKLDDIDLMHCFTANGAYYTQYVDRYVINTTNAGSRLKALSTSDVLSSIKVINAFKQPLSSIHQYNKADVHRQGEALTLQLQTYDWNFDIVPCFYTDTQHYLIPDANGDWKAANPKIDANQVSYINQANDGKVLQLIRTLKYWNKHNSTHTIGSYQFEQLVLNFVVIQPKLSDYIDCTIKDFFLELASSIYMTIPDPKSLQGDLNYLSYDERVSVAKKAFWAYEIAKQAIDAEISDKDHAKAISRWREIFGENFPKYG